MAALLIWHKRARALTQKGREAVSPPCTLLLLSWLKEIARNAISSFFKGQLPFMNETAGWRRGGRSCIIASLGAVFVPSCARRQAATARHMRGSSWFDKRLGSSPGKVNRTANSAQANPLHLLCSCSGFPMRKYLPLRGNRSLSLGENGSTYLISSVSAQL